MIVAFCLLCQYYATVPTSGFAIEVTLRLRSKLCPIAALQQVQVVGLSSQTFFVFRLYHPRLVSICCLKNVSALWDALDVTFVSSAQSYPVHLFRPHMKISILCLVMLVDCMLLFMVGVDR